MRRLRLELKQTMEMYSTACKEALTAKQKVTFVPCLTFSMLSLTWEMLAEAMFVYCRRQSSNAGNWKNSRD